MNKVRVVSAFPGVGKSHIVRKRQGISDSDSSRFSREPNWPANYIDHIVGKLAADWKVLVSSHKEVLRALKAANIEFVLVYPDRSLQEEYRIRYMLRRSPQPFIDKMMREWDKFLDDCEAWPGPKIKLGSEQYLSDVIDQILEK